MKDSRMGKGGEENGETGKKVRTEKTVRKRALIKEKEGGSPGNADRSGGEDPA